MLPDLTGMTALNYLDLSNNSFSQSVAPLWFSDLLNLTTLNIESGNLQGDVPQTIFSFPGLQQVKLDDNEFTGDLNMGNNISRELKVVNFENNKLRSVTLSSNYNNSIIAPSFSDISNNLQPMWNVVVDNLNGTPVAYSLGSYFFDGNAYLQLEITDTCSAGTVEWLAANRSLVIALVAGSVAAALIIAGLGTYAYWQKKRAKKANNLNNPFASWGSAGDDAGDAPQLKLARCFSLDEIKRFTNNFSTDNEIGSGGYGKVYKGNLSDGQIVAIKRSQKGSKQGGLEFKTEIEMLSRVHHKNLVELVGFCFEKGERMLVYEYISNGTLSDNLSGSNDLKLDWKRRLNIALGSARGLAYLHDLAKPPIIHRDVKSSNILLDDNLTAKVADFGLSMLLLDSDRGHVSTTVKGTLGYLDPEYFMTQQLTAKSDVYSFGVVMLELISSRMPIAKGKYIVREVRTLLDKSEKELYGLKDIIDPALVEDGCLIGFWRFVELALQCVEDSSDDRPTMNDIIKEIENILKDDELKEKSNSAYPSATFVEHANGAPIQVYDEMLLSREVNTRSDTTRSDRYMYSE
ncbi:hypothetical protein ZIOFF_021523 [Zingiber officinale]|uniref:non-specific serine/threonine protein kinase n=1 Tax=Zingiber officinale TaxID=94328 RepID=A0A8J5HK78_ZINOF|nr:hypothetical protein ZIOFF_021523 [Zingiber officinale]